LGLRSVGYLCGNVLVVSIDGVLLSLQYDDVEKRFTSVLKFEGNIVGECKEIEVNIEIQYDIKYFPRVYYTIYKVQFDSSDGYLLERYDGTSGSSSFYVCYDYKECRKLIDELEEE